MAHRTLAKITLAIGAFMLFAAGALADPTAMRVEASARQADGKLLFAGDAHLPDGTPRIAVGRLNAAGSFDATFGGAGLTYYSPIGPMVEFRVTAMGVQPDGKLLVAALWGGYVSLLRFDATGAADVGFGDGGMAVDFSTSGHSVRAIGAQSNGAIITAGSYNGPETSGWEVELGRYYPWGPRDTTFGSGPQGSRLHHLASAASEA